MAEGIDHHRAPTKFPAAYTGGSVINRLVFFSKHRAVSQERLRDMRVNPRMRGWFRLCHPFHTSLVTTNESC